MIRAIVLAAGQGTRLRPLTDSIPKTMVAINGKPILEYQRETLNECGINEIHVVVGYKEGKIDGNKFIKHFNSKFDVTNMVSSLYCAKPLFDGKSDILITYGDIVYEPQVVKSLLENIGEEVSIIFDKNWLDLWSVRMEDPLSDAESFRIDDFGNVVELGKKAQSEDLIQGQYTGLIYVKDSFALKFFDHYESLKGSDQLFDGKDFDNMYMTSYLQRLINIGIEVRGVPVNGGWLEVDSVEDLNIYTQLIKNGKIGHYCSILA